MTGCSSPECQLTDDNLAIICERHYSLYMQFQMECHLVTTKKYAKQILKTLGIELEARV